MRRHSSINFSAFLGYPKNVRRTQSSQSQRKPKKKSSRKIQRDNDRAANFQERKRQEEAAATAARVTSLPTTSSASSAPVNFSFAPPVDEQLQSPETLRQQSQDRSSLLASFNSEEPVAGKSNMAAQDQNDSQSLLTLEEIDVSPQMDVSSPGYPPTVTHWIEEFQIWRDPYRVCNCCNIQLSRCTRTVQSLKKKGISKKEISNWERIPPSSSLLERLHTFCTQFMNSQS